jgi:hypothetical protein
VEFNLGDDDVDGRLQLMVDGDDEDARAWAADKMVYTHLLRSTRHSADKRVPRELYSKRMDTYQMLSVRNQAVDRLCLHMPRLHALLARCHTDPAWRPEADDHVFFACWLDVAVRLTNVPSRTQCTYALEMPSTDRDMSYGTHTVARLVYRQAQLHRVTMMDKVGTSQKPVSSPLHPMLTFYVGCWLRFFHNRVSNWVYHTYTGEPWHATMSTDVLKFVRRGLLPPKMFPDTKCLRVLGLAGLVVHADLDRGKMRYIAKLARHSVEVLETEYLRWTRYNRADHRRGVPHRIASLPWPPADVSDDLRAEVRTYLHTAFGVPAVPRSIPAAVVEAPFVFGPEMESEGVRYREVPNDVPLPLCADPACRRRLACTHVDDESRVWSSCGCGRVYRLLGREEMPALDNLDVAMGVITCTDSGPPACYDVLDVHPLPNCVGCPRPLEDTDAGRCECGRFYRFLGHTAARSRLEAAVVWRANRRRRVVDRAPVVRGGRYGAYVGVDCSKNGVAITVLWTNGTIAAKVYYWCREAYTPPESGAVHFERVVHDGVDLHDSIESVVKKLAEELRETTCCVGVEEPLPVSRTHSEDQRVFTLAVRDRVAAHFPGVRTVDNSAARTVWLRYTPTLARRTLLPYADFRPPLGLGKRWGKFLGYVAWERNGFPRLLDARAVEDCWKTRVEHAAFSRQLYKFTVHPVSDIVDAMAVALYLRALDGFGPARPGDAGQRAV